MNDWNDDDAWGDGDVDFGEMNYDKKKDANKEKDTKTKATEAHKAPAKAEPSKNTKNEKNDKAYAK